MKNSLVTAVVSCLLASSVGATTLLPKRGVDILYINGQAAASKIGESEINEGFNQIVLRMNKDMSKGSSSDVFTSKPFVISFNVTGDEVVIDHPVARSTREAQKAFDDNNPKWFVKVDGKFVDYNQSVIEGKSGFLPFSGLEKRVAEHNAKQGIYFNDGKLVDKPAEAKAIAVATTTAAVASTSSKVEKTSPTKPVVSSNIDQLKAWYLKSSQEERKAFRRWMIDQE